MEKTTKFIKNKIGDFVPEIGIVLGSGLGELADEYCDIAIPYSEIPDFIKSNVAGHKGQLVFADRDLRPPRALLCRRAVPGAVPRPGRREPARI